MQRRQRAKTRERALTRSCRSQLGSTSSLCHISQSADSFHETSMRKEVDKYREQVLRVYPDMDFEGSAKRGESGCYCCVLM